MTIRDQIVAAGIARFVAIEAGTSVTVNGTAHTFTFTPAQVDKWRTTPYEQNELVAINLAAHEAETDDGAEIGRREHALELIAGVLDSGDSAPDGMANKLLDLFRAMLADTTLASLAHRIRLTGHEIEPQQTASTKLTMGTLRVLVIYRTDYFSF